MNPRIANMLRAGSRAQKVVRPAFIPVNIWLNIKGESIPDSPAYCSLFILNILKFANQQFLCPYIKDNLQ